ncbi:MAG: hypothetical protein WKG01_11100 [Kofleriaceae bacterium]
MQRRDHSAQLAEPPHHDLLALGAEAGTRLLDCDRRIGDDRFTRYSGDCFGSTLAISSTPRSRKCDEGRRFAPSFPRFLDGRTLGGERMALQGREIVKRRITAL